MRAIKAVIAGFFLTMAMNVSADAFPSKAIRLIVPYAPGGTSDIVARSLAQGLSSRFGQPVVVENKSGAGGTIAADMVAKSPADGYTVLVSNSALLGLSPLLYSKLRYDTNKDLAPVSVLVSGGNVLVVEAALPVNSLKELISYAKANPGRLNFASGGSGTGPHLNGELLKQMAGVDIKHVPYKGSAPGIAAVVAGEVQIMFDNVPTAWPFVKAGRLRALAVTETTRNPLMPDVPTMAEAGLPGFEHSGWFSLSVPAGTPHDVLMKLNTTVDQVIKTPEFASSIAAIGFRPVGGSPEKMAALTAAEAAKWGPLVKALDVKLD